MAHTRVQQYFRGVPVFAGQAIAHLTAAGEVFGETDDLIADVSVDTTPRLTRDAAIGIATAHYGCTDCLTAPPTADLWIVRDREGVDRLTYCVQLARLDGTGRTAAPVRFVDAHGGDIVLAYDNLHAGTGSSIYSGTVTIGTHWNSTRGDFALENHGPQLGTFDARNSSALTALFTFLDPDDVWDAPNQRAAVDVHYGLEQFFAYLSAVHGRNGIDGSGGPFTTRGHDTAGTPLFASVAHYGLNYSNAFWYENKAYFGDGDGSWFAPLVTLDIVGHELMHGVTQYTAGLQHVSESGSISESWSDVFGAMLERYVRGEGDGTWRAGEEAFTPGTLGDALRYLDDPHRAPGTVTGDDDPDHYSEACTPAHGGCWGPPDSPDPVYLNMGIASKAFYLLAKGGTHHLGGSMEGIGADEAARIWFLALTSYMTSSTGFWGARTATMQAATALFGLGSSQLAAVEYAWCLVGVGTCRAALDVISVTPDSGEGMSRAFTLTYSDSAGVTNDLGAAQVRFAETNDAARSCTVHYRATTGMVRMQDDDGNWGPWASFGGGMLANSQCSLDLAESAAATNGPNLTLTLDLTFARGFVGQKTVYMRAASVSTTLSTGWRARATWRVGAVVQATAVTPDNGIGRAQSFAFAYADDQGVTADLTAARVRFAAVGTVAAGSCTIDYNAVTDRVRLQDDGGTWGASVPFGSGTLNNSQCTLDLMQSGAAATGPSLTLTLQITFATNFTGTKNVSMQAISATGTRTPWLQHGTWQVPSSGPNVVDVAPARASGVREVFALHYWDESGASNLTSAQVKFAPSYLGPVDRSTCTVSYDVASGAVSLMNDAGTG
ncbi:MAG TPA: M4 family metallopeptidase, partial [Vicinamibacterales bacterium]